MTQILYDSIFYGVIISCDVIICCDVNISSEIITSCDLIISCDLVISCDVIISCDVFISGSLRSEGGWRHVHEYIQDGRWDVEARQCIVRNYMSGLGWEFDADITRPKELSEVVCPETRSSWTVLLSSVLCRWENCSIACSCENCSKACR